MGADPQGLGSSTSPPTARRIYLAPPAPAEEQEALERDFFSSLRLRNGTYKDTYAQRLNDLNDVVNNWLPRAVPLRIMDVAISSGISTIEWAESLRQHGIEHEMVGGDLTITAYLVSLGRDLHALVDETGYPLQFEVRGEPLPNPMGKRPHTRHFLSLTKINHLLRRRFSEMRDACAAGHFEYARNGTACRRIMLVSPRLARCTGVATIKDDILSNGNVAGRFHVVRAANILNRAYFDGDTITTALCNLRDRLLTNGCLVVCRTDDLGKNNATLFALDSQRRFSVLARLNDGSEIEASVLGLPA